MPEKTSEEAYQAASDLFAVDPEICIAQAKKNLQAFYISSYWIIENSLLIACAEDNWEEAEYWRLFAEDMYERTLFQARYQNDTGLLEMLALVREELDEVEEKLIDSPTGMTDAERAGTAHTDEDEEKSEDEDEDEDEEENEEKPMKPLLGMTDLERNEVEEKDKGKEKAQEEEVAEENEKAEIGAVVPEHKDTLKPPRALPLRSKGGAANAHEFTKSLGMSGGKTLFAEWKA
ncbi:hypothetical protein J4E83_005823 [Alternaria metachromatica]|uniref:uncharacterized protein n=1 Tax=Alternaria metachromatica TaxID=283354 RepID=UPI0020C51E79|nr:uncharacterized protein J4E83_005823 [Alternaria metachromatica]KAI4618872.1 hypothetical protein J4E83_005823 [Alternaria metachromatica]